MVKSKSTIVASIFGVIALIAAAVFAVIAMKPQETTSTVSPDQPQEQIQVDAVPTLEETEWTTQEGVKTEIVLEEPPTQKQITQMDLQDIPGGEFRVDSVGLDTSLGEMSPVDNFINPPDLYSAYMLRNHGTPGDLESGTVFVALHSVAGAQVPGNKLIDVNAKKANVSEGDVIEVLDQEYKVTSTEVIPKNKIAERSDVWENENGRLVVVTCLQRYGGHSFHNVVIEAEAA